MHDQQNAAAQQAPQPEQTQKNEPRRTGIGEMRDAADLVLNEKCVDIADALTGLATKACVPGVKLLCDLAREKEARGESSPGLKKLRSLANEWVAEQEWQPVTGATAAPEPES